MLFIFSQHLVTGFEEMTSQPPFFFFASLEYTKNFGRWCFVTERYFGRKNREVHKSRLVTLKVPFADMMALNE